MVATNQTSKINPLSRSPLNWIDPSNACFLEIGDNGTAFEELKEFLRGNNIDLKSETSIANAPWQQDAIRDIVNARSAQQFVLLTPDLSAYALALCGMALETGYDTYLVSGQPAPFTFDDVIRLSTTGIKAMRIVRFMAECRISVEPSQ